MSAKTTAFIKKYGPYAQEAQRKTGIPACVTLAQAILESGWGKSGLTLEANNFFGMKAGGSWNGSTYTVSTREQTKTGAWYTVMAAFRRYVTPAQSFIDHNLLFYRNPSYAKALPYRQDWETFITIVAPTYATDLNYAKLIKQIVNLYNLDLLNVPVAQWQLIPDVPKNWRP